MTRLTYLGFHALFIVPPLVVLAVSAARRRARADAPQSTPGWTPRWVGVSLIALVALVYTTPWDNYLISRDVWWYGEGTVVATVWLAPVEEYLFMLLQPVLVALWLYRFPLSSSTRLRVTWRQRAVGVLAGAVVCVVGLWLLRAPSTYYLGAILAWAGPVLALQWGFGWPFLWLTRRTLALAVAVPTLYLWVADRVAIELGVWVISETYTTGVMLFGLPVEEAVFFLVTNLFVVQGLLMFLWVVDRWTSPAPTGVSSPGTPAGPSHSDERPAPRSGGTVGHPPRLSPPWWVRPRRRQRGRQ